MYNLCNQLHRIETYLLQLGGDLAPVAASNPVFGIATPRLRLSKAHTDRGIRTPTSSSHASTQPACVQPLDQPEEHTLPRIPRQQPVDQPPPRPDYLAWHLDECRAVRRELHPQQRPPLRLMAGAVPRRHRDQQRGSRPSGSTPTMPSPCTPSCSPGRPRGSSTRGRRP